MTDLIRVKAGDIYEFDIEGEHWDALFDGDDVGDIHVGDAGVKVRGSLFELMDYPRVAIVVKEVTVIH